ncbi:MAG: hypothetical protein HFI69_08705 [Lachnospiraceae bacterium]|nr:hypothetical protein [Lachnospiraceae bacterium]
MRQQEDYTYQERRGGYIDGNTVRRVQTEPRRRSEEIHREYVQKQKEDRERKLRQRNARAAARRNREQALLMSPGYVMFLAAAMLLLMGVFGIYLLQQSQLNNYMKSVTALEANLMNLKNDNDAAQKKINSSVDLDVIRQRAMGELGMVYPSENQIQYFEVDEDDYMNQYEDIPER